MKIFISCSVCLCSVLQHWSSAFAFPSRLPAACPEKLPPSAQSLFSADKIILVWMKRAKAHLCCAGVYNWIKAPTAKHVLVTEIDSENDKNCYKLK